MITNTTIEEEEEDNLVIIVGAGPSGLATAASLSLLSIPYIVLERADRIASLWRYHTYDRLKLHLSKRFCQLPHKPHPPSSPSFLPRTAFIRYLEDYAAEFNVRPKFGCLVESAAYWERGGKWVVNARGAVDGMVKEYVGRFLVVATGENGEPVVPEFEGMEGFRGEKVHSMDYKSGERFRGKNVLVVGGGNSGMEIAYDLSNCGAFTSISFRGSEVHLLLFFMFMHDSV